MAASRVLQEFSIPAASVGNHVLCVGDHRIPLAAVPADDDRILLRLARDPLFTYLIHHLFLLYAYFGPLLPAPWTHRGYDIERIIGHMYMTLEGVFGVPIDLCSTIIAGFCIFGAFLTVSGAGKFYVDFAFASMGQKPTAVGRAVVATSYFLAMVSGSGVVNTVAIGSVAYPMLSQSGYDRNNAGGVWPRAAWAEGINVLGGVWTIVSAFVGIGLLASGCSGWLLKRSTFLERAITIVGALGFVLPWHSGSVAGAICVAVVVALQKLRKDAPSLAVTH